MDVHGVLQRSHFSKLYRMHANYFDYLNGESVAEGQHSASHITPTREEKLPKYNTVNTTKGIHNIHTSLLFLTLAFCFKFHFSCRH